MRDGTPRRDRGTTITARAIVWASGSVGAGGGTAGRGAAVAFAQDVQAARPAATSGPLRHDVGGGRSGVRRAHWRGGPNRRHPHDAAEDVPCHWCAPSLTPCRGALMGAAPIVGQGRPPGQARSALLPGKISGTIDVSWYDRA